MATLKEFEDALRQHGMTNALAILDQLKKRDREQRSIAPARRVVGRKMTAELARTVVEMHATTGMTQQEIAFKLGVNQGRVNEVIKRGKWLNSDPAAPEAVSRDKAMDRLAQRAKARRAPEAREPVVAALPPRPVVPEPPRRETSRPAEPLVAEAAVAELPLQPPAGVKPSRTEPGIAKEVLVAKGQPTVRAPLRRPVEPVPPPIVSAQLAFLDL